MTKVYLGVGHGEKPSGGHDPGASAGKWTEQSAGDIIVSEAARLLRDAGVEVKDEAFKNDPTFIGTTKQANSWGADFVVEIHHDWSGAPPGAFGHWISSAGKSLADDIQTAVGDAEFPLRNDWHKKRTDLYILKNTEAPAVLYEVGRIAQKDLNTEAGLRRMGQAVATGIARHLGVDLQDQDEGETMAQLSDEDLTAISRAVWGYRGWQDDYPSDAWSILRTTLRTQVDASELARALADKLEVEVSGTDAESIIDELASRLRGD